MQTSFNNGDYDDGEFTPVGVPAQRPHAQLASNNTADGRSTKGVPVGDVSADAEAEERQAGLPNQSRPVKREAYQESVHGSEPADESSTEDSLPLLKAPIWLRVLRGPVVGSLALLLFSALMLLVTSTVFQFIQTIQAAPEPLRWAGYAIVSALVLMIGWSIIRLSLCYLRRSKTPSISKADIHAARHRPYLQQKTKRSLVEGRRLLEQVLNDYPVRDIKFRGLLSASGCVEPSIEGLQREIDELRKDRDLTTSTWLTRCDQRVFSLIDTAARKRIWDYSLRVGIKTAVMPSGAVDLLIVVANSLLMLKDLCYLYNVRTTPWGTCSIAAHVFMNAFVAARLEGQISDFAPESIFGGAESTADPATLEAATETIGGSVGTVFSAATLGVGKRAAEGAANALLINRLGEICIRYLRPIQS